MDGGLCRGRRKPNRKKVGPGARGVTGCKWVGRYEAGGLDGLRDLSRAPQRHPNEVSAEIEGIVIALRAKHPSWGGPKIRARIERDHARLALPAESTIGAILKRNGLTVARSKRRPRSR